MKYGDFTELAVNYAKYRPGYSPFVLDTIISMFNKPGECLKCADIGAGTGIWSRMLASRGMRVWAVEPNAAMREAGHGKESNITWVEGSAENTGLPSSSVDLATMASSFHWADFEKATKEFARILKPHGLFVALWNTRNFEIDPLLSGIEDFLYQLAPDLKRRSSGRSEFCDNLWEKLASCKEFSDVLYIEGRHREIQTPERYIGLWESVNDVRVGLGEERFARFIQYVREALQDKEFINAEYITRAWVAKVNKEDMG